MLHRRTSADTAPVEVRSERVLRLTRSVLDEAPAIDGIPTVVVMTFESEVIHRFADLAFEYEREGLVEARGPPLESSAPSAPPAPSLAGVVLPRGM